MASTPPAAPHYLEPDGEGWRVLVVGTSTRIWCDLREMGESHKLSGTDIPLARAALARALQILDERLNVARQPQEVAA